MDKNEREKINSAISSVALLYSNIRAFITENFPKMKDISKQINLETLNISSAQEITINITHLKEKFSQLQLNQSNLIKVIQELLKKINENPNPKVAQNIRKKLLEIPLHINSINSYMKLLKAAIESSDHSSIELIFNMINISSHDINIK